MSGSAELRGEARELQRRAYELQRRADQEEYEATLNKAAFTAADAVKAERAHTARYEAAAEGAVTAERTADDRVRAAADYVAGCAEAEKLSQAEHAPPEDQVDATLKLHAAAGVLDRERQALEKARQARQQAERALAAHREQVARLEAAHAAAARQAAHPGDAPRSSTLPLGVGRTGDLTDEERALFALLAVTLAAGAGATAQQKPEGGQYQRARGGGVVVLPPPVGR